MKWLIGALAAALLMAGPARAAEDAKITLSMQICAKYQGCWSDNCQVSPERRDTSVITCRLVDGEGAYCDNFRGNFVIKDGGLVIEAFRGNAVLQVMSSDKGTLVRVYEKENYTGMQCIATMSVNKTSTPQKKPAAKPDTKQETAL